MNAQMSSKVATGTDLPWFALQIRSGREALVADSLRGKELECFLPLQRCRRRWSDRIKEVTAPLFPGYLFCRFHPQERLPILTTPGVVQIVGRSRIPVPVDESEICAIQALVASGAPHRACAFLQEGDVVQIQSGPLAGISGVLIGFKGNYRLVLSVTLLQRSVAVELDSAYVTALQPAVNESRRNLHLQLHPAAGVA
jgi:transcription antitermination factor NusG